MENCNCGCSQHGPTIEGLGHIALYTRDIDKTVEFYTDILGFQKIEEFKMEKPNGIMRIIFLICVDIIIEVIQEPAGQLSGEGNGAFQHIAIQVTGLEELIPLLKEEGVEFETESYIDIPEMFNGSKCIFFKGPNGERLELFEYGDVGGCEGDCCHCENSDCCGGSDDEFGEDEGDCDGNCNCCHH